MDYAAVVIVEVLYGISVLVLISAGLAVVFGMMRVINLAHGEFIDCHRFEWVRSLVVDVHYQYPLTTC